MDDEKLLIGRMSDLYDRADKYCGYTYSDFLTLAEQDTLLSLHLRGVSLWGGYDGAERKIAVFRGADCMYEEDPPLVWLKIEPRMQKYADALTHRDILGSLLALGIRREVTGDIILYENVAYLCCEDSISAFIASEFKRARHTDLDITTVDAPPEASVALPEISRIVITSERLDSIVSAVYKLSRSESQNLFEAEKISVGGKVVTSFTHAPKPGSIISVRGHGRLIYEGISGETKKGRLTAEVRIFK